MCGRVMGRKYNFTIQIFIKQKIQLLGKSQTQPLFYLRYLHYILWIWNKSEAEFEIALPF